MPCVWSLYSMALTIQIHSGLFSLAAAAFALRHVSTGSRILIAFRVSVVIGA